MRFTLIAAQSLDGFITHHDTPGSAFASAADRAFFREALRGFDCCVMGGATYRTARESIRGGLMPDRLRLIVTRSPKTYAHETIPGKLEFVTGKPGDVANIFEDRGLKACAILGGSQVHSLFLDAGLVDELWITIEPLLFGGGTPLLANHTTTKLKLLSQENLAADTLLLKYRVAK
ncbi:MAG: dihydrofolate reductase [Nibricoccus sp.]